MTGIAIARPVFVVPQTWHLTRWGAEFWRDELDRQHMKVLDRYFRLKTLKERILMMAGSDANYLSAKIGGLVFGKTAYTGETTWFVGLWTAALDDTFNGATASEAAYTSYARMSLTNNTTNFAAGTGTTTSVNTWPSDAAHNFATSTGGSSTVTNMGVLNGNAGTSSDKGGIWATVSSVTIASGDTPQLAQNAVSQTRD